MRRLLYQLRRALKFSGRLIIYAGCGLATVFILANSYETAFGQTLPYVHAVSAVNLSFIQPDPVKLVPSLAMQTNSAYEGNYGSPLQLKIGSNDIRIPVGAPIYHNHNWLAQASTAHYIITSPAKTGDLGDTIIYMNGGRTTIADISKISVGSNVFLDTKRDWRYFYRVDEVDRLADPADRYVLPAATTSRLYVVVQQEKVHYLIAATLTDVQNANQ